MTKAMRVFTTRGIIQIHGRKIESEKGKNFSKMKKVNWVGKNHVRMAMMHPFV